MKCTMDNGSISKSAKKRIVILGGGLPRLPKKLRVVTGWTLDLLFSRDLEQMLTMRDVEAMSQMAGRVRKLVAEGSTMTSLTERRSTPVFLEARRTPEEELA